MTRRENINTKLESIERYLIVLERYRQMNFSEIEASVDLKGAVERYLYLAAQAAIDLAEMIVKFERLGPIESMSAGFARLYEAKTISKDLLERLVRMVGFRNVLSHGYEKLDYSIVSQALSQGVTDIREFISAVRKHLG